ncbi:hypothetical protein [Nonomuraea sp. LPB2021202275-12-8]|uniref:hypothetical protein n=1 Tax=Nonomuraea sp. LPB2021202275-12-8 TaxID=3120159 RepID=UPI00300CB60F
MAVLDIHFDALDDCRSAAKRLAGKFGELAEGYPAETTSSSIFGKLAGVSALATAVDGVEKTASSEFGKAKTLVEGVERALDQVQDNVRTANKPS